MVIRQPRSTWRLAFLALAFAALALLPSAALAQSPAASLAATVNGDRSVDLTLSNGPSPWYFRIDADPCTTVTGTTLSGIRGYAPGYHEATAFANAGCAGTDFLTDTYFIIPTATLAATVNTDHSVDLTLSNGPSSWWFRINSWGTCTAATGTTVTNIRGYKAGTHSVDAYSDGGCSYHVASSSFTIPTATLAATVNNDRSVDLTLTGGPAGWWFKIGYWGTCTAAAGTTVTNIRGYKPGAHAVDAYSDGGCNYHVAASSFTIPTATLTATVNGDRSVTLTLTGGPAAWWFRINWWGTCTAASGTTVGNIQGYQPGNHAVAAYSDGGCSYHVAVTTFDIYPLSVSNLSETSTQGSPSTSGGAWIANEFTTGGNTNGYTVSGVTVPISPGSGSGNVTLRIFSKGSGNANPDSSLVTLTNTGDTNGSYTFSCSGTGCDLSAGTSYFLVLSAATGYSYSWAATASNNETGSVGWSIGNAYTASTNSGSTWTANANSYVTKFSITATPK